MNIYQKNRDTLERFTVLKKAGLQAKLYMCKEDDTAYLVVASDPQWESSFLPESWVLISNNAFMSDGRSNHD